MQNIKRSEPLRDLQKALGVLDRPAGGRAVQDSCTERLDFCVICARLARVDQKIHLKSLAVDMPQDVHEPGFDAPAVH
jgi:hypothetical protein